MRIHFAALVFDPGFRCNHASTARNHCPDYVQGPTVGEDCRTNFTEVSWDGQLSPGSRVVCADNPIAEWSIVIAQPP
jgi:hypothetical protein